MTRLVLLPAVLLVGLAAGCGGASPLPERDHWIGVEVFDEAVAPGQAFPVVVTRVWNRDRAAAAWDDGALAPLDVRLESVTRDEDSQRVRETRRFRAWAFALADVTVPPVPFAARPAAGGEPTVVSAPAITVRVRPTLLETAPGAPELPGPPLAEVPSRAPWIGVGLAVVFLGGLGLVAARRRRGPRAVAPTPDEAPAAPAPHEVALARLARLRAGDDGVDVAAVAEVVRAYVASRYAAPAPYLSTEEVLAAPGIAGEVARGLAGLLALADRTKFAAYVATAAERAAHLEAAEAFVRRAAPEAAS
jgi:hypothetical protein